jgi:hypothetical protein
MTSLSCAGFFVLLCGLVMCRRASNNAQITASMVPIGVGAGVLVIALVWGGA